MKQTEYSMRAGRKPGSDDAGKARHYMQKLNEFNARGTKNVG